MITRDGRAKVLDFGLAKLIELRADRSDDHGGRDRAGHGHGHGRLHVAGAGRRATGRRAVRHLLVRRGPLRDARRPAAVQRLDACRCHHVDPPRSAARPCAPRGRTCRRTSTRSSSARSRRIPRPAIPTRRRCAPSSLPRTRSSRAHRSPSGGDRRCWCRSPCFCSPSPASASGRRSRFAACDGSVRRSPRSNACRRRVRISPRYGRLARPNVMRQLRSRLFAKPGTR